MAIGRGGRSGEHGQRRLDRRGVTGRLDPYHAEIEPDQPPGGVLAGLFGACGEPAQPSAYGRRGTSEPDSDGPVALPGGVGGQGLANDLYGVGTARQPDAWHEHVGAAAPTAAAASWMDLAVAVAGA